MEWLHGAVTFTRPKRLTGFAESVTVTRSKLTRSKVASMETALSVAEPFTPQLASASLNSTA